MAEKIKAINPEIIVSGDVEKPYFQIKYYDTADSTYHIGFGSYNYGNVLGWIKECFEPIEADEQPVVHGRWVLEREPNGKPYCFHCSVCDEDFRRINIYTTYNYCPDCGAKMDEEGNDT